MSTISEILQSDLVYRLGPALLHSLWQIAALGCILAALLSFLQRRSPNLRYLVACGGMAAMFLLPLATFWLVPNQPAREAAAVSTASDSGRVLPSNAVSTEAAPLGTALPRAQPRFAAVSAADTQRPPDVACARVHRAERETPLSARLACILAPCLPWFVAAWFVGVASLSVWHLGGWVAMQRLKHLGTTPAAERWAQRLAELADRMKLGRPVQILCSTLVDVPAVIGWLRPVLLAPVSIFSEMSPQQIDAVLAHELAHIRRWDYLVNLLQALVETLLFHHPAVWWLSRRIRIEREHCCDDLAVSVCGVRIEYAEALASLAQRRVLPQPAVAARTRSGGAVLRRVRRILGAPEPAGRSWGAALGSAAAAVFAVIIVATAAGYLGWADETRLGADEIPNADEAAETQRTKVHDIGGLKIEAGFLPDETEIILGQPSFVTFAVTNRGDRPYRFAVGGDNRGSVRHNNFRITAVDAQGQPIKDPYSYNHFGGPTWQVALKPGESHRERLCLGHWLVLDRPGVYAVTCQRTLQDELSPPPRHPPLPIATRFKLKVLPYDRAKMQQVIARLGKHVRESGEQQLRDATLALADINDPAVIPHLAASLRRGDFQNRIPAVNGLEKFPDDAAGDALREAMQDPDHAVREAGGRALRKTTQVARVVETLLKNLGDGSADVRQAAATALGQTGSASALDPLIQSLDDAESRVAQAAAVSLGELGDKRATEPLHRKLQHKDRGLRVAAADGLRRLTGKLDPAWLTPVVLDTTDINDQTFHESIRLIRVYAGAAAAPALIGCLRFDEPSPKGHYNFFLILAIHHAEKGPDCYYRWKHDPNTDGTPEEIENNRKILAELKAWAAERSSGRFQRAPAIAERMRGMSMQARRPRSDGSPDPVEEARRQILDELRALGKDAVPALADTLRDQDMQMRQNAALVLIELRGEWTGEPVVDTQAAVPALIQALKDSDADVRAWAAHALAAMGPDAAAAVDTLIALLKDPEEGPRNTSAMALGAIGPAGTKAVGPLTEALQDRSEDVRRIAAAALQKIRKPAGDALALPPEAKRFALYRVLGHRRALPFGSKEKAEKVEILFSDEGDGSRRFDAMRPGNYPLAGLILDKAPLLTEADIVGYVWPKHEIHLRSGVCERLVRDIRPSVWGVPFAIVAQGEPVYLGAFWTGLSSYLADMPTINVDAWQWTVPEPDGLPKDAIRIELSQVLEPGEVPTDPRDSPRLREALNRAGKLLDRRPGAGSDRASGEPAWGEAVDGVQVRLTRVLERRERADAPVTGLVLCYDAKNEGSYSLHLPENGVCHQVEVDGQWYAWTDSRAGKESDKPLVSRVSVLLDWPPGSFQREKRVEVAGSWFAIPKGEETEYAAKQYSGFAADGDRGKELVLTPGKHRVRLAVTCPSARASFHGVVRAVSQAAEVEIAAQAAQPTHQDASGGAPPQNSGKDASLQAAEQKSDDRAAQNQRAGNDARSQPAKSDDPKIDPQRPWTIVGTVNDGQGRPLEGVQIRASCGWGTLMPTGETASDQQGKYTLRFGPGMRSRNDDGTWSAGIQAATIYASKPGYTEKNLCRHGDLLMGDKLPEEEDRFHADRERVVVPGQPRRLDFVMVASASLEGELVDEQGRPLAEERLSLQGNQMMPSTSVLAEATTDRQGRFRFEGVPANFGWWFAISDRGRTQALTLPGPGSYLVKLQLVHNERYNLDMFQITRVTDPQGVEVRDRMVADAPLARPPVAEDLQEQGREYLRRMAAACRDWLGPPSMEIKNYEYRFRLGENDPQVQRIDEPRRSAGAIRQGITYYGTPHALASRPEKVVFRQVEAGQETILLRFLLQDGVKIVAGNGITGRWRGYFSTPLREGVIVLDKTTCRPMRTEVGGVRETFSKYVQTGDGRFAPLAIRIEKESMDWDWTFRVYQPGLWLLSESRRHAVDGDDERLVTVDEVKLNGRSAVRMTEGEAPGQVQPSAQYQPPAPDSGSGADR